MSDRTVFISYARPDHRVAKLLALQLRALGISTWIDQQNLELGTDWTEAIAEGIRKSTGLVIIASAEGARSAWVQNEIGMATQIDVPIFPIVIGGYEFLPPQLAHVQAALVRSPDDIDEIGDIAREIAEWLKRIEPGASLARLPIENLAADLAKEAQSAGEQPSPEAAASVFVVHGHNKDALNDVRAVLDEVGVRAVVLAEIETEDDWLLQRFLSVAEEAIFAVVIFSADDLGASLEEYNEPNGGLAALQYRARQNVILELGFFLGKLKNFNRVFVLRRGAQNKMPRFEDPSDLAGKLVTAMDSEGRWKSKLLSALRKGGVTLSG
ncbi:MAG: nucleotide-binding protein [Hyphomicrobium sp.]|nr:nucleotide-binding protein [Hyphomicrobium sp.]